MFRNKYNSNIYTIANLSVNLTISKLSKYE
jgi:hypothetical protein